ncbi:MAG: hypothetical protein HYZ73_01015, partial [Elusimicrobia bacterium]|nr:hypothetical protein [Elusimicrobiota bacterium]
LVTVDLAAAGKGRAASRWRQVVVYVGRKFYRIPVVQLAKVLGRSESAISMMLARSWKQIDEWPETQQFLSALERHCAHQGKM